jgi:hypothetical protein
MAHFVELDENNIVTRVIVVHNNELFDGEQFESEQNGIDFCVAHYGGRWIQTSYNANFRKNYAGIDYLYDPILDAFISPKPFQSWILNEETCQWESPVPHPTDEKYYIWNEENTEWVEVINDAVNEA